MQVVGGYVQSISLPEDRSHMTLVVTVEDQMFHSVNLKFRNSNYTPIKVNVIDLSLNLIGMGEFDSMTLGELEWVYKIDDGYELVGDFGSIQVFCDYCSLSEDQIS